MAETAPHRVQPSGLPLRAKDDTDVPSRIVEWFERAGGGRLTRVRLFTLDPLGRLYLSASAGDTSDVGPIAPSRRRLVLDRREIVQLPARRRGHAVWLVPMQSGDRLIGIVELVAPQEHLEARSEHLVLCAEHAVPLLESEERAREVERSLGTMDALLHLVAELMRTDTPVAALHASVRLCEEHTGRPAAAARPDRSGHGWFLAAAEGVGSRRRSQLRSELAEIPTSWPFEQQQEAAGEAFTSVARATTVDVLEAGDARLFIADATSSQLEFLRAIASILGDAMERISSIRWTQLRNENLDLGIAWTAHELKAPLVGAMAGLDYVLSAPAEGRGRNVLERMRIEIEQLSELVDPLLRWSAGVGSLEIESCDLVSVVRAAVDSCILRDEDDRVMVSAPDGLIVQADAAQLRTAVANLVRNSLAYSPTDTRIAVEVGARDGWAWVSVRDHGPGVDASERHLIFDPFARGGAGEATRGKGLGLFIARRVAEAHGGTVSLHSRGSGATFRMRIPLEDARSERCAS